MTAMPVDSQIEQVIAALAAAELGPGHELTPQEARAQYDRMIAARGIAPAPVGAVEDRTIPDDGWAFLGAVGDALRPLDPAFETASTGTSSSHR